MIKFIQKMAFSNKHKRYFINNLSDFNGKLTKITDEDLKNRISNYLMDILSNVAPTESNSDGGLYVGTTGIAYTFLHLSDSKLFDEKEKEEFIQNGLRYINPALSYADKRDNVKDELSSFILGNAGTYAIAATLSYKSKNQQKVDQFIDLYKKCLTNCKPINFLRCGGDELFVGRAGYICGDIWLKKYLNREIVAIDELNNLCEVIVQSGKNYSSQYKHACPLMYAYYNVEYLGAAHGLCTILLMLLSMPNCIENTENLDLIRRSVDYLLSLQSSEGNFPCAVGENCGDEDELVHWCHGAPGIVYLMAKAYLLWKSEKYLNSCLKCGEIIWKKGLLRKGPGICHGIAGNGYVFLLLYRLTNDLKHLHRANEFANFLLTDQFKKEARQPDCPFSLYEGVAGTVCFLADLAEPDKAAFPFLDVF